MKTVEPNKLMVSFLNWQSLDAHTLEQRYKPIKKVVEETMNKELPGKNVKLPDKIDDAVVLTFNSEWAPQLIRIPSWAKVIFYFSFSTQLRETLRPVLRERGLSLGRFRTIANALAMLFLVYGIVSPVVVMALSSIIVGAVTGVSGISPSVLGHTILMPNYVAYVLLFGMAINKLFEHVLERHRKLSVHSITK